MHNIKALAAAAMVAALAITAFGAPAAAIEPEPDPDGTVAFVNGMPGKNLEVCVDGVELKSFMRYGRHATRTLPVGPHKVAFRTASAGRCKGTLLSKRSFSLAPMGNMTIVASKGLKRIVVVDNMSFVPTSPTGGFWSVVHAAMAPPVLMLFSYEMPLPPGGAPAASEFAYRKGDSFQSSFPPGFAFSMRAVRESNGKQLGKRSFALVEEGVLTQQILVGTKGHFRWVTVRTPMPFLVY